MDDVAQQHMLTTIDNPWNPFTNYDEWYAFDLGKGYNTAGYLARITKTSDDLSAADQDQSIEDAIVEICTLNIGGIYKMATPPTSVDFADAEAGRGGHLANNPPA